jgi:hypothetical protein
LPNGWNFKKKGEPMRPGREREIDARIAKEIFGFDVFAKNDVLFEVSSEGERPLRTYSRNMESAWDVASKMRIAIIPIDGQQWFAFAKGAFDGWSGPEAFLEFLKAGDFSLCGACVHASPAQAICEAALVSQQKRMAITVPVEQTIQ